MQDDYGEDLAEQKMLDYRCQWAYVEALPVIEQMGMAYFINMISERYYNEKGTE
tara:strand:+ start:1481 stop:1642 length:162 start_codon:yes stop_codon:yes gene_type:complete